MHLDVVVDGGRERARAELWNSGISLVSLAAVTSNLSARFSFSRHLRVRLDVRPGDCVSGEMHTHRVIWSEER